MFQPRWNFLARDIALPIKPLTDKTIMLRILDDFAGLGICEEQLDEALVRHGPVDLDLLAECKREHPYFAPRREQPGWFFLEAAE
ncbi:hypothetical protein [Nitratireductor sp. CH_MIT9313-5]|uniref:hypothetical protein n=1 Tax=Nitratireductor sp. CH_MIT9313-5 TaxID=3107764 RepID=UPI003009A2FA